MLLVLFTAPFSVAVDVYVDFGWVGLDAIEPMDRWTIDRLPLGPRSQRQGQFQSSDIYKLLCKFRGLLKF